MYYVYILKNEAGDIYVGSTSDVEKRLERHKKGEGAEFTRRNRCFTLCYVEAFRMLIDARARERQIKGWRREKKENLIQYGKPLPNQPLTNTVTP